MQTFSRNLIMSLPIGMVLLTAGVSALAVTTPGVNGSVPGFAWSLRTTSPVTDHAWSGVTYEAVNFSDSENQPSLPANLL